MLDTVDPDVPSQNPNDPRMTGFPELGNAIFDQRHRFVLSGVYIAPFGFTVGGIATLATGLPYDFVTGVTNSGDTGATTDRPVIGGHVVGRNTGRGTPIYDVEPFVGKRIALGTERLYANLPSRGIQCAESSQRHRLQWYIWQRRCAWQWLRCATRWSDQSIASAGIAIFGAD
jgi:hypothetical protein